MTTLALGKHPLELHAKIVAMVTIVEATKQRDFSGRLKSELVYTMYVNPIAVLCIEVYKLEIPLLTSPDVRELTRTDSGWNCIGSVALFGKRVSNEDLQAFVSSFVDAFVSKYCM